MASLGEITTYTKNPAAYKAQIAAEYNGCKVDMNPNFNMGTDNRRPEFLKKFPMGKVPVMDTVDGPLCESDALLTYVAYSKEDSSLLPANKYERAEIVQYSTMVESYLIPAARLWYMTVRGMIPYQAEHIESAKKDITRFLSALNEYLAMSTYLVGERVTIADISVVCSLINLYQHYMDASFRRHFVHVNRWFHTCINKPQFKKVIGEFEYCVKAQEFQGNHVTLSPKKASTSSVKDTKKDRSPSPSKSAAKVTSKKPAKEDDAEEEEDYSDKPVGKNPLDLLPKSSFNLEDWKRFYSNNETRPTAIDYFWKNFDNEGYCIYRLDYKYNNELTKIFMTTNLVGGFFQRMEGARKYIFGSMLIFGEDNKNSISGYFVYRGHEIPFEVRDTPDYDSYTFTKVNTKDAHSRELINQYWAWDAPNVNQGKVFK